MDVGDLVAHLKVDRKGVKPALAATEADADRAGESSGRRFGARFATAATGRIRTVMSGAVSLAAAAGRGAGSAFTKGFLPHVDKISNALKAIGKVTALAGVAGGAIALAAAASQASGALVALPAAGGAAAAIMATLKVGTKGVGDALSALADGDAAKAAEAMAKLSPAARAFVTAADGVRKSYAGLKTGTQDALFRGLAEQVTNLGSTYLPILSRGLTSNAAGLNAWAMSGAAAARSPFVTGAVASILDQTAGAMARNAPIAGNLVTILAALGNAGMPLFSAFMDWASGATSAAAAFLSSAQGATWLTGKINLAKGILSALGSIVSNVGSLLASMFRAADGPGTQLLGTLVTLTQQAATWAASMEGQQQLTALFGLLSQVLTGMLPILGLTGQAVMALASFIATLPAPVQGLVTGFMSFALVAGLLLPKVIGLVTVLRTIGGALLSGTASIVMAAARWGLMGTAAQTAAVTTNASTLSIVGAWLRMAVASTANAIRVGAAWLLTAGANAATAVAGMVAAGARIVAQWTLMAVQSLARAAMMAASWLIAMGPIGWIIAAVVALVALVIANWDTVKNWTVNAWNAVSNAVSSAVSAVIGFVTNLATQVVSWIVRMGVQLVVAVVGAWARAKAAVSAGIAAVIGFVSSLPGRILSALSSLGSLLVGLGGDLVRGLWRGIQNAWSWLTDMVSGLARRLLDAAKSALGIGSPSKEMRDEVGRWIPAGMAVGIRADGAQVGKAIAAVSRQATAHLSARAMGGSRPGGAFGGDAGVSRIDPADLAAIVDALEGVAARPVELDGKQVNKGLTRRARVERRLVTQTRR